MAFLVYTILRRAASTAGHIRSCSAVSFNRCLMLAICASLSTLLERLVTRRAGAGVACAFGGSGFAVSVLAAASPVRSDIGGAVVSIAARIAAAAGWHSRAPPGHAGQAALSQTHPISRAHTPIGS